MQFNGKASYLSMPARGGELKRWHYCLAFMDKVGYGQLVIPYGGHPHCEGPFCERQRDFVNDHFTWVKLPPTTTLQSGTTVSACGHVHPQYPGWWKFTSIEPLQDFFSFLTRESGAVLEDEYAAHGEYGAFGWRGWWGRS